jgi:hypothetical protein
MRTLILMLLLTSAWGYADTRSTEIEAEIEFLLDHVRSSQLVFIRNGKDYDAQEAYEHMIAKYRHFERKVHSAEAFIEYSATRSLISGRPYRVRLSDGTEMEAGVYLLERLAQFRASRPQGDADP